MRIQELRAWHVTIPLRRRIKHATFSRDESDTIIVRCTLDQASQGSPPQQEGRLQDSVPEQLQGWGEGLPRPYVTGDTIETCWQLFRETNWPAVLGACFSGLSEVIQMLRAWRIPQVPGQRDSFGNPLRAAIELSILDAVSRAEGRPLSDVVSLIPETLAIRGSNERVRYSGVFTAHGNLTELIRCWQYRLMGFSQIKAKVAVPGQDDVRRIQRLRNILGKKVDIRLDANEGWSTQNLEKSLEQLSLFGISTVEQPLPHAELEQLGKLRPRLGVPIMLDESLCSLGDARRAVEHSLADLFNIRISKCGGMINSLLIAAEASRAGLGFQLGCQVGETGILSAAGRHFACGLNSLAYLEGSFDRYLVRERLIKQEITFGRGGWAPRLPGPGLGVEIDQEALKRVSKRTEGFRLTDQNTL